MEVNYEKWHCGWLQWGHEFGFITEKAEKELKKIKEAHPEWNFEEFAKMVRNGTLKPVSAKGDIDEKI